MMTQVLPVGDLCPHEDWRNGGRRCSSVPYHNGDAPCCCQVDGANRRAMPARSRVNENKFRRRTCLCASPYSQHARDPSVRNPDGVMREIGPQAQRLSHVSVRVCGLCHPVAVGMPAISGAGPPHSTSHVAPLHVGDIPLANCMQKPHPKNVRVAIAPLRGDEHGSATATTHPRVTGRSSHYVEASPHPQWRREAATNS